MVLKHYILFLLVILKTGYCYSQTYNELFIDLTETSIRQALEHTRGNFRLKIKGVMDGDICIFIAPKPEYVVQILKSVEAAYRPEQVGIDEMMTKDSLILAKEVRVRYGLLQLLWDLGLLEDYSNAFVQYYRSN